MESSKRDLSREVEYPLEKRDIKIENLNKNDKIKLGINLLPNDQPIYLDAYSIEPIAGYEDVFVHGSPSSVQITIDGAVKNYSPEQFAKYLADNGYGGKDLRLASCSTGKGDDSFAQRLSKELGCKVMAPDDEVYYAPNEGVLFVGDERINMGKWRIFNNGEEE